MKKVKEWVKDKADKTKEKARETACRVWIWTQEHPEQAATIACTVVGVTGYVVKKSVKGITQNARLRKETKLKERYIYDRSLGRYWLLRRRPTQREQLEIERLRKMGLKYGDILTRLKLI